jgi:hypothetical protein
VENVSPPWVSNGGFLKWPVVECQITSISYDFPSAKEYKFSNSVIAKLSLKVLGQPLRWDGRSNDRLLSDFGLPRATRNNSCSALNFSFNVNYRLNDDTPDFLIPRNQYLKGVTHYWKPGVKFYTYFKVRVIYIYIYIYIILFLSLCLP